MPEQCTNEWASRTERSGWASRTERSVNANRLSPRPPKGKRVWGFSSSFQDKDNIFYYESGINEGKRETETDSHSKFRLQRREKKEQNKNDLYFWYPKPAILPSYQNNHWSTIYSQQKMHTFGLGLLDVGTYLGYFWIGAVIKKARVHVCVFSFFFSIESLSTC